MLTAMRGSNKKAPAAIPFVRKLCAPLGEEEIREAEQRFAQYARIVIGIFERIEREKHSGR